jgi:hypothetical protein
MSEKARDRCSNAETQLDRECLRNMEAVSNCRNARRQPKYAK